MWVNDLATTSFILVAANDVVCSRMPYFVPPITGVNKYAHIPRSLRFS